jgi:serine/threonine-protein kinase
VLTAGGAEGVLFYTTPFVEDHTLHTHLTTRGRLSSRDAMNVLRDIARALAHAHRRGVIHRDIKPENVLLSGGAAVVADFGIARAIEASSASATAARLTQPGMVIGTPLYMSPEQAAGDQNVDQRADCYAWGVLAYELLTGAPPFPAAGIRELLAAHISQAPRDIREAAPRVDAALSALVMRCLSRDPARRPQNARSC